MPFLAPFIVPILVSVVISAITTVAKILLTPSQKQRRQQQQAGPTLAPTDTGTRVTTRDAAVPQTIIYGRIRAQGTIVFVNTSPNNQQLQMAIVWAGHECSELGELYFNDQLIPLDEEGTSTGWWDGMVHCYDYLGTEDQQADPMLMRDGVTKWDSTFRGLGICYSAIWMAWPSMDDRVQSLYPEGLPNIWRVVKGKPVMDPRTGVRGYSNNAALCVADYLCDKKFGYGLDFATQIDQDWLAASANICDELIPLASGGTEPRYTANGLMGSDVAPSDGLRKLLSACAGAARNVGGKRRIAAAAWTPPVVTFDESDFRDTFDLQVLLGIRDSFNAIKGKYANPDKLWQPDDFPAITSAAYEAEDGGRRVFKDVSLDFTESPAMAQRVARIDLRRARQTISFTAPLKLRALQCAVGDVVSIDNANLGWAAKPFEVLNLTFVFEDEDSSSSGGQGPGIIGVDLDLRETDSTIFDWAADEEITVDPAPNTNLPDLFDPRPPTNLVTTEQLYVGRDAGGVKTRLLLSWGASPDPFVIRYRLGFRAVGDTEWSVPADVTGTSTSFDDLQAGAYDVRVASVNRVALSSYLQARVNLIGLTAIPAAPTGLTLSPLGGAAWLRWDPTPDLDVRVGGTIVFRHSPAMDGSATWDTATGIGQAQPGAGTATFLALKPGTYLAKFRDSGGRYSATAASVITKQATAVGYTNVTDLAEGPDFSGAKTDCAVAAGKLKLDTGEESGTYLWSAPIDLGSVQRVRLTVGMAAQVINDNDLWDSDTLIDDTPTWAADVSGSEADSYTEYRQTDDDPGGASPTWSAWERLDSAEAEARGFEFRTTLEAEDTDYSIEISALAVAVDQVT